MELAHSSEGYPIPALSPVDEAGLICGASQIHPLN